MAHYIIVNERNQVTRSITAKTADEAVLQLRPAGAVGEVWEDVYVCIDRLRVRAIQHLRQNTISFPYPIEINGTPEELNVSFRWGDRSETNTPDYGPIIQAIFWSGIEITDTLREELLERILLACVSEYGRQYPHPL